jgi:hypothetical protein
LNEGPDDFAVLSVDPTPKSSRTVPKPWVDRVASIREAAPRSTGRAVSVTSSCSRAGGMPAWRATRMTVAALTVVAEGVEDDAALSLLAGWGCDRSQGYYISRPVPLAGLHMWLQERAPHSRRQWRDGTGPHGLMRRGSDWPPPTVKSRATRERARRAAKIRSASAQDREHALHVLGRRPPRGNGPPRESGAFDRAPIGASGSRYFTPPGHSAAAAGCRWETRKLVPVSE